MPIDFPSTPTSGQIYSYISRSWMYNGTGWQAIPYLTSGSVVSGSLAFGTVFSGNVASGQIGWPHIASGAINSGKIGDNTIVTNSIASGQVTGSKIAASTVANANLVNSTITIAGSSTSLGGSWAAAALTTSSGLLAGTYYPSGALTIGLASGGITSQLIADGAVGNAELATSAVTNDKITSGTVANDKLANSSVTIAGSSTALGGSWAAQSLTAASGLSTVTYYPSGSAVIGIASGGIVAQMMGSGSVTANAIASGSVTADALASGAISAIVGSGAITSGDIGIGAINNLNVASGTLSNDKLVNSSVTINGASTALGGSYNNSTLTLGAGLAGGSYNGSGAVTASVASGGITSQMLADGSVASGDIAIGAVNNRNIASGTVANDKLTNSSVTIAGSSTVLGGTWAAQSLTAASGLSSVTYYPSGSAVIGIASGGIIAQMMGSGSVTANAIASGSVTADALASGAISAIVGSGSITSGDVGIGAINNLNVASGTLSNDKLANSTVTIAGSSTALGGSWAAQALTTASGLAAGTYYPSGALTIGIATNGVVTAMIASGAVGTNQIASGAVTGTNIAATTVANANLVNSAVTIAGSSTSLGGSWAAQSLTAASGLSAVTYYPSGAAVIGIASGGIIAQMMGSGSVTTNAIASGSVTANALASGAISAIVGSGAITSGDIGIGAVNNLNIASGTVSNDKLVNSSVTINGASTALGGSYNNSTLTLGAGLAGGSYNGSGAVTASVASGGITSQMLADAAVASGDVAIGAINNQNIASGTVANDKLANSAVTIAGSSTALGGSWAAAALTTSSGLLAATYYPSGALTIGIASGGITSQMLADASVTTSDIASGAVGTNQIASGAVTGTNIAATTVANVNLVNSAVTIAGSSTSLGGSWAAQSLVHASGLSAVTYYPSGSAVVGIASGGIVAQMMASGSVTANAIASGSVTADALASGAISAIVGSGAITSGDLGIGAVNNLNIASGTVANDKLANSTVTIAGSSTSLGGSWAAQALTTASGLAAGTYYPSGALTIGIASGGIVAQMMGSGSVTTNAIASGSVTANALASGAISAIVGSGAITSGDIGIGAVNNLNIVSGTISNDKLANSAVTINGASTALGGSYANAALTLGTGLAGGSYNGSGAVTASVASGGITSQMLADAAVASGDVAIGAINNQNIASGTVANDKLANSAVTIAGSSTSLGGSWAAQALSTSSGLLAGTYYPSGSLTIGIANAGIVSGLIASGQVGAFHLASGTLQSAPATLASGQVTSGFLGNASVVSGSIASGSIGSFHISSGTYVTNINAFPTTASGLYYVDFSASLSGSAGTFTSSGLVFNPRSGGTLGIGDVTNPTSRLTVTHNNLYPGQSLQVNTTTVAQYSGGVTSGSTTYANDFTLGVDRGSVGLTAYAARFYTYGYFTGSLAPPPSEYGALYANVGDIGGSSAPNTYGIRIQPGSNSMNSYGLYVGGGGAASTNYGIYVTATGYGGNGNWGIYAEVSNTGGARPAIAAQFKIAGNVTHYARGLVVDAASATVSRDYYGAIIDATNITALSGKIALYVSDGTSTATFGNGSGGAALFTGGNVGVRTTTPSGALHVETGSASRIGTIIRGFTSQTANLTEWQNSAGSVYARVNASGEFFGLLSSGIVTSGAIASGSVGTFHIASGSITSDLIASGAIINADVADNAVTSGKIASGTIGTLHISSGGVQNVNIASGAVLSGNIASGQIGTNHLSSGTTVTNLMAFPATASGLYYVDFTSNISGSTANFTSSGLVYNPGPIRLGLGTSQPTSRLHFVQTSGTVNAYEANFSTSYALFSGGLNSGSTTYAYSFNSTPYRASSRTTDYAMRIGLTCNTSIPSGPDTTNERGGLYLTVDSNNNGANSVGYGLKLVMNYPGSTAYGVYSAFSGIADSTSYAGYFSNPGAPNAYGIYVECSNTGGLRNSTVGQFRVPANVTGYAYGLLVNTASITVGQYYYGAYIDASGVTASSGKVGLYVADGTTATTIGNGTVAASFTGGNVGIGLMTPSGRLEVANTTSVDDLVMRVTGSGTLGAGLHLNAATANGRVWRMISTGASSTPGAGALGFYDSTATSYRMVINTSGSVGIGTASPNVTLDVRSNIGGGGMMHIASTSNEASIQYRCSGNAVNTGWVVGNYLDDFIAWSYTYNGQVMTLKPTGNVGIGNTTPSGKLHVEVGNASRIGVIVRGFTSQTANLTEWQNSSNFSVAYINASGSLYVASGDIYVNGITVGKGGNNSQTNTGIGRIALSSNTSGSNNTAIGYFSLTNNTTGNENTAIGSLSLQNNATTNGQTAVGYLTLNLNSTGYNNTALGNQAMRLGTAAYNNVAVGDLALLNHNGYEAVAVGHEAGRYQANGSTALAGGNRSVYIGAYAKGFNDSDLNSIVIGYTSIGQGANTTVIGNSSTVSGTIYGSINFPFGIRIGTGGFGISSGGVFSGTLAPGTVTSGSIASGQIGQMHLSSGAVNSGHLAQFATANINIISGTIANDKLANSTITIAGASTSLGGTWAAAALTTASGLLAGTYYPSGALTIGVASGGINSSHIASGAVVSGDIGNSAVVSGSIASGSIGDVHLASGALGIAGSSGQIQFNAGGALGASAALTFSSGTSHLNVNAQATNIVPLRITVNSGHSANAFQVIGSGSLTAAAFDPTGVLYCSLYTGAGTNTLINASIPDNTMQRSVIIGQSAYSASGQIGELVAIGYSANANRYGVAVGQSASAAVNSIALGLNASASNGNVSIAIGSLSNAAYAFSCGLGSRATPAAAGDLVWATETQNPTIKTQRFDASTNISYLFAGASTWIDSTAATKTSRFTLSTYYTTSTQEAIRIDSNADQARVGIGGAVQSGTTRLIVYTGKAAEKGLVVQGFTSQTANLLELQDSSLSVVASVNKAGGFSSKPNTTALTASQNNYAFDGSSIQRVSSNGNYNITGITYPSGLSAHSAGRFIRLYNINAAGGNSITLVHNSSSSSTGNKFWNVLLTDIVLGPLDYAELIYDDTDNGSGSAGWRVH